MWSHILHKPKQTVDESCQEVVGHCKMFFTLCNARSMVKNVNICYQTFDAVSILNVYETALGIMPKFC